MIIHASNVLAAPLMLVMWTIDVFVFLACMRLVLGHVTAEWARRVVEGVTPITDPIPQALGRCFAARRRRAAPAWAPWLSVFGCAIILRYLLLAIIASWL